MKKVNQWIDTINNYYAFALLVYTAALFVAGYTNLFFAVFITATPVIAGWSGYLLKGYIDKRNLLHGFRVESNIITYEVNQSHRYILHYDMKLKAGRDHRMMYPITYQWSGSGEESIPKLKSKHMRLMVPYQTSRKSPATGLSLGSDSNWKYWFIALDPPAHKDDSVSIDYSQDFYDKKGKALPQLYYVVRVPMKRLVLNVSFAKGLEPRRVACSYTKPSRFDRQYESTGVEYDRTRRWATWTINNPKVGYHYKISWDFSKKV